MCYSRSFPQGTKIYEIPGFPGGVGTPKEQVSWCLQYLGHNQKNQIIKILLMLTAYRRDLRSQFYKKLLFNLCLLPLFPRTLVSFQYPEGMTFSDQCNSAIVGHQSHAGQKYICTTFIFHPFCFYQQTTSY